jgi:hypothetical protein
LNVLAVEVLGARIIKEQFGRRKEYFPIRRFGKAYGGLQACIWILLPSPASE